MELEETVAEMAPGLLRYCLAVTRDATLAEDVAQDALTALVSRWRRLGPPDTPAAFAFSIARRRAGRAMARRRLLAPANWLLNGSSAPAPDRRLEERERLERTAKAMGRLTRHERSALEIVVIGGLALEPAAEVLGTTGSALKMRVHRARRRLRAILEAEHE